MEKNNNCLSCEKIKSLACVLSSMKDVFIEDLRIKDSIIRISSKLILDELKKMNNE
jgi:hypothetical protein